jgi:hypothetical protein
MIKLLGLESSLGTYLRLPFYEDFVCFFCSTFCCPSTLYALVILRGLASLVSFCQKFESIAISSLSY